MYFVSSLFDVISLRSFSNIWYWIVLAAMWTLLTQTVMGVPVDMIGRAKREGGQVMADVEDLCRIKVLRISAISPTSAALSVGIVSMLLSALGVSGFVYGYELAQAVFLLLAPMALISLLTAQAAQKMIAQNPGGAQLCDQLHHLRLIIQGIALLSIASTAIWGMWRNLYALTVWG